MIVSNDFITREVSATGGKSLCSFGLYLFRYRNYSWKCLNIGEGTCVYGGLEEALKDATKLLGTKSESSATNPIGIWAFIYTCMLEQPLNSPQSSFLVSNSTVVRHQGLPHIGNMWWKVTCFETGEETVNAVWQCLIIHPLQTNPWPPRSRHLVDSCHVPNALPSSTKTETAELRLSFLPIFLLCLSNRPANFPVHLFFLICCTLEKDHLALVQNPFSDILLAKVRCSEK